MRLLIEDGAAECHNAKELSEDLNHFNTVIWILTAIVAFQELVIMEHLVPLGTVLVTLFLVYLNAKGC